MFEICFFKDRKGGCPVLDSLEKLPEQAKVKSHLLIERLAESGHNLRRPDCDFLENGVYELRWHYFRVQYRILYFFTKGNAIVLSHLITKESKVPKKEIDKCIENKKLFEKDPDRYTHQI